MEIVHEYFSRFDLLLINQADDIASKSMRRTVRLKDLVVEDSLFDFICWLVSDNERELYFSRNCAIKFFHCEAKNELLKVLIELPNSIIYLNKKKYIII